MKILIIDDIQANLRFMARLLEKHGFQVVTESNPRNALDLLTDDISFRAIIVDYMMPEMNGMEFFEQYKALPRFRNLHGGYIPPCILITAWSSDFTSGDALHLGFFKVLKKPFTNETLLMVLENIRTGNVFRKKNALFVNCPNEHSSNIRLLGEKLGYQFFFIETLEKALICLKSDSKIGTVFCYEGKNSQKDCDQFALDTKSICRYDDSGNAIVPSLILITPQPTERPDKTSWDRIVAETTDYRSLAKLMHELQDKNNEGQIENPRQMVIALGDIGINTFFLEKTLTESGYNLLAVDSPSDAYQLLNSDLGSDISLILSSSHVNECTIEEFIASCQTIRRTDALFIDQALPFIITTDFPNDPIFQKLPTLSSTQVFLRPIDVPAFRAALESVLSTPSIKMSL